MPGWCTKIIYSILLLATGWGYYWIRQSEAPMVRHPIQQQNSLMEPDAFVRWRLVERSLHGEDPRIRWIDDDNAPFGRINEWTSPMTYLGVGLSRIYQWSGQDQDDASRLAGHQISVILGLASLVLLALLGWRTGGPMLGLAWILAWPALEDVIVITRFGNPDHHALHQFLYIGMIGGVLAAMKHPTKVWGTFVGIVSGLALWSAGSELMPAWCLVAGLLMYEMIIEKPSEETRRFWRAWWISGFVTSLLAWLFEFWPSPFHAHLEMLSWWHVLQFLLIGLIAEYAPAQKPSRRILFVLAAGAISIFAALAIRGFALNMLHVFQDPRFHRQMMVTREFEPLLRGWSGALDILFSRYGWLPLLAGVVIVRFYRQPVRIQWLVMVLVVFLLLALHQMRWSDFLIVSLVLCAGIGAMSLAGRRAWIAPILMVLTTAALWRQPITIARNVALVGGNARLGPHMETFVLQSVSSCIGHAERRPIVLAPWDCGSALAGAGRLRVVGSAYWSNLDGLVAGGEAFATASSERFKTILRDRSIDYVLLPPPDRLARAISQGWMLAYGMPPTREELTNAVIWRWASRQVIPREVICPDVTNLQPGWRIVDVKSEP